MESSRPSPSSLQAKNQKGILVSSSEIFHNLPDETLYKAAKILESEGKVAVIEMSGSYLIKFAD